MVDDDYNPCNHSWQVERTTSALVLWRRSVCSTKGLVGIFIFLSGSLFYVDVFHFCVENSCCLLPALPGNNNQQKLSIFHFLVRMFVVSRAMVCFVQRHTLVGALIKSRIDRWKCLDLLTDFVLFYTLSNCPLWDIATNCSLKLNRFIFLISMRRKHWAKRAASFDFDL